VRVVDAVDRVAIDDRADEALRPDAVTGLLNAPSNIVSPVFARAALPSS
jgi:hypothetical protein